MVQEEKREVGLSKLKTTTPAENRGNRTTSIGNPASSLRFSLFYLLRHPETSIITCSPIASTTEGRLRIHFGSGIEWVNMAVYEKAARIS
jgi:hypothetical protein